MLFLFDFGDIIQHYPREESTHLPSIPLEQGSSTFLVRVPPVAGRGRRVQLDAEW